jgi:hypothetical protein
MMSIARRDHHGLRAIALVLVLCLAAAACSGSELDGAGAPAAGGQATARDARYTYQPDVVFIGGGAVLGASSDGIEWTIDGSADGVDDLRPGSVMYASSAAVGRVSELRRSGDDVVVRLAPVELTEVFRDAHFQIDQAIDAADLVYQEVPDLPAAVTVPDEDLSQVRIEPARPDGSPGAGGPPITIGFSTGRGSRSTSITGQGIEPTEEPVETIETAPVRLIAGRSLGQKRLPPESKNKLKVGVGDWDVEPSHAPGKLGLKVTHKAGDSLKVSLDVSIKTKNLRIRADTRIQGGQLLSGGDFVVEGFESIAIAVAAGSEVGASANKKVRIEVPVDITWPIPGEPLVYSNKWKFSVATAIGGNNSTITGAGLWSLDGALGVLDGKIVSPTLTTQESILESLGGIALAPSGIVFAVETKMQFGIGIPAAFAGPYAKLVVSLGVVIGSALGAPLARCVGGTLDAYVGGGAGFSLSTKAYEALKKLFPKEVKLELEVEELFNFKHLSQTIPEVSLCRTG